MQSFKEFKREYNGGHSIPYGRSPRTNRFVFKFGKVPLIAAIHMKKEDLLDEDTLYVTIGTSRESQEEIFIVTNRTGLKDEGEV